VISHNDQFVTNAGDGEVLFLNENSKESGQLEPLSADSFDVIKNSLGGVIMSLEQLNNAQHVVFVEGRDDAEYLRMLNLKLKQITNTTGCLSDVVFFPLRGKDNILQKIEYNKRTLASMLKGKTWNVIYDRDFSTSEIDTNLKSQIVNKGCVPHSHSGYCIESVLFSDVGILKRYLSKLAPSCCE